MQGKGEILSIVLRLRVYGSNKEELKKGIGSYFKSMFEETQVRRPVVVSGLFRNLDSLDNETLEGSF